MELKLNNKTLEKIKSLTDNLEILELDVNVDIEVNLFPNKKSDKKTVDVEQTYKDLEELRKKERGDKDER